MSTDEPTRIWVPIGCKDRDGREIHLGDSLSFDRREWGSSEDHVFVVELKDGDLQYDGGGKSDFTDWCRVVKSPGIAVESGRPDE